MRRLATIDLGTNTVRLLVAELDVDGWRAIKEAQRVTRLGQGQAGDGVLEGNAMDRTVATLVEFVAMAEGLGSAEVHIVATSAVREARNQAAFIHRVRAATGRTIQVVSGAEEARLALRGVASGLPALGGSFLLLDIGGGSTELVLAAGGRARAAVSLTLGVVPLTERFMDWGPVDRLRYAEMAREVECRLRAEVPAGMGARRARVLVGTAGTVTTLAALDLGLATYEAGRVQGYALGRAAIERQLARLGALGVAERAMIPCLEPGRADVLIAGIAICLAAMRHLGFESLVVSDRGLREGILCEILST